MRKTFLVATTAAALTLAMAAPAMAADTTTTFTVTGGTLTVAAAASATLTSAAIGGTASGSLGTVTVTDARNNSDSAWTATAQSGSFTTGAGDANRSIANTAATYTPGALTESVGGVDNSQTAGTAGAFGATPRTAASNSGFGNNTVAWTPTLAIVVPAGKLSGVYQGTVTHSVS